jgi:catechol 2,3-dioxygenase-like lactoylglutathione lyase family enzyme
MEDTAMFDHVSIKVKNFAKAKPFYAESLAPLGYKVLYESEGSIGMGDGKEPTLWISQDEPVTAAVHVAFASSDRKKVDAFHAAALKAGGRDNGAPGLRPDYSPTYYAAFAHDPDGNNIEAVCKA